MSSKNVNDLLYDSAAALRLVDRELQSFSDLGPGPVVESAASPDPVPAPPERLRDSAAEVRAGLGRVRQLLHESHFGLPESSLGGQGQ